MSKIYVVYGQATMPQCVCGSKAIAKKQAEKEEAKVKSKDYFDVFESNIKGKLDVKMVYELYISNHISHPSGDDLPFYGYYKTREELIQAMFEEDVILNLYDYDEEGVISDCYGHDEEDEENYKKIKVREKELLSALFSNKELKGEGAYFDEIGLGVGIRLIPVK